MQLHVSSEVNALKGVVVHTPGREVSIVNPEFKDDLLFDDIIFEDDARREHSDMLQIFAAAMGKEGRIFQISQLIAEVFEQEEARHFFIEQLIKAYPEENLHTIGAELKQLAPFELLQFSLSGTTPAIPTFSINPTPNLLFTRDLAVVVGDSILVSRAAKKARIRESLMMEALVNFHPMFSDISERAIFATEQGSIEGGDILVYSDKLVLIGMSERTSFSSLMTATEALLKSGVEHVLAVDIPKQRSSMHLDTIFTFADHTECVVFPPAISERTNNVVALSKYEGRVVTRSMPSLKAALEELTGKPFTFINCGGEDRTTQFREQWTDGANVFALAPGVIVGYERNTATFETLAEHGYQVVNQFDFIEEYANKPFKPEASGKLAIAFRGHELCRGRGGARCMTMPVKRAVG